MQVKLAKYPNHSISLNPTKSFCCLNQTKLLISVILEVIDLFSHLGMRRQSYINMLLYVLFNNVVNSHDPMLLYVLIKLCLLLWFS